MTRQVSKEEFMADAPGILGAIGNDVVIIEDENRFVAALVGEKEFRQLREARGRRALAAMDRLSDAIEASGATQEELKELEATLDRKA